MKNLIWSCAVLFCIACGGSQAPSPVISPEERERLELPWSNFYPENLSAAADGTIYVGSLGTGAVLAFAPGETLGHSLLPDGAAKGVSGVLVDEATHSLLVAAVDVQFQATPAVKRFDLATGKLLATYAFPGTQGPYVAFPNDFAFDGAGNLYVSDSFGHLYRLTAAASAHDATLELWSSDPLLAPTSASGFGADGITWDGAGNLYVNNNQTGKLVRVPINADGSAGAAVEIPVSPALTHPDGMRQLDANTLVVVDNAGALVRLQLSGASAAATVLANGLDAPTGVVKLDDSFWVSEGQITTSLLTGSAPNLPFEVRRIAAY
jgi:sugar lactone lactonase YvrE